MAALIETSTAGAKLVIEIAPEYSEVSLDKRIKEMPGVMDSVLETVSTCGKAFTELVDRLNVDEFMVKFGVNLDIKTGKLISMIAADIGGGAIFEVSLSWKKEKKN